MNDKNFNLNEKDIFKLLNDVKIEESEFDDMFENIDSIEKNRIKKNLNKKIKNKSSFKKIKYTSIAAAVTLTALIGVGKASPAFAKKIPVLNSIIEKLNAGYGDHGEYAKYSEIVNKSVTDNGITLTINEVIADDSKLIISYTIKSDKKVKDLQVAGLVRFLEINGKHFSSNGCSTGTYVNDLTYVGSEEIHTTIPQNSNSFNIDLDINEIGDIKGHWKFAFTASKEEICKKSTVFKTNKKLDFPNSIVTVDKIVFSPISTSIFISGDYKDKSKDIGQSNLFDLDYWIAYDDNGVELQPQSIGGGHSNSEHFNSEMSFVSLKSIPKYLTVIPCKITPSAGGGVTVDKDGNEKQITIKTKKPIEISKPIDGTYPIELPQGKMGKLIIKEIKREKDKTIVKFTAQGKAPYFQAKGVLIKDEQGKTVDIKNSTIRSNKQNPNEFTKVFESLDPNKKYTIFTNDFSTVEFREDLKFKIELKN